ncbi:pseudaminic acid cytidylyltransferase [Alteromonas sp. KUL49]|uniref:pseudaminic acid cytidylyltransferase n=1 Tax=Alteromonas sp. KUL49 TaxID=2480798 RepID=UPI00102EE1E6|nr:pseudaminic acid cytidylyltransferase [Alteromonas sp. KUL49]TAP39668.1 pseudaminic acid cytidylyltransferase [Alteromonas sp. KUL49]GEA11654.1 pseudaminic acid cytidylyltransferase [Alteromonas sp. KUL49]
MNIAVIPARGGSKRIVGKNIREFVGKPLIAYSIEAARESQLFDEIIVTTDSDDIANVSIASGATYIVRRDDELANDHIGTFPVVKHAIQQYEQAECSVDYVCCIYATAPFISSERLKEGINRLSADDSKYFAFSVTSFPFPVQRSIRLSEGGVTPVHPDQIGKRSQDLEEYYHDAGQFYWGTKAAWLESKATFATHSIPVILPRYLVQDIDTQEDWKRAELMYRAYKMSE